MTPSTLKSSIKAMQKELEIKIPYLNHGGCIWFAYYFEKALKRLNIPYKIYAYHHSEIGKTYSDFHGVGHIVTYVNGIGLVDGYAIWSNLSFCDGYTNKEFQYRNKLRLKNLYRLATGPGWNHTYDTEYNSKLETIINTYIK